MYGSKSVKSMYDSNQEGRGWSHGSFECLAQIMKANGIHASGANMQNTAVQQPHDAKDITQILVQRLCSGPLCRRLWLAVAELLPCGISA